VNRQGAAVHHDENFVSIFLRNAARASGRV
jgi:hypothetical protein